MLMPLSLPDLAIWLASAAETDMPFSARASIWAPVRFSCAGSSGYKKSAASLLSVGTRPHSAMRSGSVGSAFASESGEM